MPLARILIAPLALVALAPALAEAAPPRGGSGAQGSEAIARLRSADTNHDGAVTRPELLAYRTTQWDRFDRNGDGVFSREDLPSFLQDRWDGGRLAEMRGEFDANHDGRITRAEFTAGPTPAFDMADANGDGRVTEAELKAATAAVKSTAAARRR